MAAGGGYVEYPSKYLTTQCRDTKRKIFWGYWKGAARSPFRDLTASRVVILNVALKMDN